MWLLPFAIFLLVVLLISVLMFKTYTFKSKFLRWLSIILPPLLLIYLIRIPFDIVAHLLWLPGQIAFLISIVSIIATFVKFIRLGKDKEEQNKIKIRFVRPILTILIFLFALLCLKASQKSADDYATITGKRIQGICNAEKSCPKKIDDWDNPPDDGYLPSIIYYGKYGTKYMIYYSISKDGKEFDITVKHNIDEGLDISGGVGKELRMQLFSPKGEKVLTK